MSNPEHNAKTPSAKIGLFAMLGALLPGLGRGAPSAARRRRPRLLRALFAALTVAAPLLVFPTSAPAMPSPPTFPAEFSCTGVTHTSITCGVPLHPGELETHWIIEYATVPSGPWAPVPGGSGTITKAEAEALQFTDTSFEAELTGLTSETTYYFRAFATNEKGKAEAEALSEPEPLRPTPEVSEVFNAGATSARVVGVVYPHGFETHWRYEYATSKEGPWTSGPEGIISQAEVEASEAAKEGAPRVEAALTGLTPGSPYHVRLFAEDEPKPGVHKEATSADRSFETAGPPAATTFPTHALHGEAMRALGFVATDTSLIDEIQTVTVGGGATGGNFELCLEGACTTATATGVVASGSSTVGFSSLPVVKGTGNLEKYGSVITGVATSVGRFLEGHPISGPGIPPGTRIGNIKGTSMEISQQATASVSGAELISSGGLPFTEGEAISGAGIPADTTVARIEYEPGFAATLTLSAKATESGTVPLTVSLPYNASTETVRDLLTGLIPSIGENGSVDVSGRAGGPYTIVFGGGLAGKKVPQMTADASGLTPSGTVVVATVEEGSSYDTRYDVEYVSQAQFGKPGGEGGFAKAESTPEVDFSGGSSGGETVGVDLPGLQPGETYHFRLTATNTTAGDPVVHGSEEVLTVPVASSQGAEGECPNAQLRSEENSTHLPDCRAYEQLTPVDKEGAMEPFHYGLELENEGALVGADGDHLMLNEPFTQWGSGTGVALSPYFFSRGSEKGWQMTAATLEPEAGLDKYYPELVSPDLTRLAFSTGWNTGVNASPDIEFKVGPPGGPYVTAASVPRGDDSDLGWVAASEDFSKLILAVTDHRLIPGHPTGTTSGVDLYEYSGGGLRQANVTGPAPGVPIGSCGAVIVAGHGEPNGDESSGGDVMPSGARAVSADGSRVFFEAVPGSDCSEPTHLYMRVNGAETRDLGAVGFLATNKEGTKVLVEKRSGEAEEVLLYDTESATARRLFTLHEDRIGTPVEVQVSEDFNVIYLSSDEHLTPEAPPSSERQGAYLYRYEIGPETLRFLFQKTSGIKDVSPDGRYVYIGKGEVAGLPAGGLDAGAIKAYEEGVEGDLHAQQAFLYDSTENMIECVSCASPYDPEPKLPAFATGEGSGAGHSVTRDGMPGETAFSANGDFAFFDTPAALVPQDVNGEREPEEPNGENPSPSISVSSDVYEWRKNGVDGCGHVQGCVSLISSGREGFRVLLLGSTESGSDVFFTTRSQLGPNDNDNSLDIYDARVDGGESPLPPRPVECEGDACSTPFAPPSDLTPSSATFQGAGDVSATSPEVKGKAKPKPKPKPKKKKKGKPKKTKGKIKSKRGKKAQKSNRRGR